MVTVKLGNWSLGFGTETDKSRKRPLVLLILDGWGYSNARHGNAIALANTPNFDRITKTYPGTLLAAAGTRVGLTPKAPGNPEIGHLNLGTGRAVKSKRLQIEDAIANGSFFENEVLKGAFEKVKESGKSLHLVGLLSDGEVNASTESLFALLRMAKSFGLNGKVFVHGILDGVDVPPRSSDIYVEAIEIKLADIGIGRIATICGRQYAMDNTENWQRTARAYTMLAHSEGIAAIDPVEAIRDSFLRGLADEFVQPIILFGENGKPVASIDDDDVVIFFNHRGENIRQLVKAVEGTETEGSRTFAKPNVNVVCLTEYDTELNLPVAFTGGNEANVLADIFEQNGIENGRFSEPDRLEHMTFFFNGRDPAKHRLENRIVIPSPVLNGVDKPEMSSFKVTDRVLRAIENGEDDVYIVNLSAADIAARTGNLEKTIQAVQFVDTCLGGIVEKVREFGGIALVTSDHGNCEDFSQNGSATTAFTSNPVPFFMVGDHLNSFELRQDGALEDVAPTLLAILGIEKPDEMTGRDLRVA